MTGFRYDAGPTAFLYHPDTSALARHGFFGRAGGVSDGLYDSLNCGYGSNDDPTRVASNRARAAAALGLPETRMAAVWQVHGADVLRVDRGAPADRSQMAKADGLVTTEPGLGLTILTADCLPLLLAEAGGRVVGACHAGWRGAARGIVDATVQAMRDAGAGAITALIGPTIQHRSYQVGPDMREDLLNQMAVPVRDDAATCFTPDSGKKWHFDLPGLVSAQLRAAGVSAIHDCGVDTYTTDIPGAADSPGFFSHRRATHAKEADCGRQIAVIALPGPATVTGSL
ncbi:MAG: polyphenol oxidase family protein [Pseudomonadota bacterium]|nr:polyphenol oxidase family protein [Pseudomonadota bacterium]